MRFIFIVAFLLLVSSTEAVESESSSNSPPTSRFAYATIHYEGTKRDDEYVLGILVWIESLLASKTSTFENSCYKSVLYYWARTFAKQQLINSQRRDAN